MASITVKVLPKSLFTISKIKRRQWTDGRGTGEYVPSLLILFLAMKIQSKSKKTETGVTRLRKAVIYSLHNIARVSFHSNRAYPVCESVKNAKASDTIQLQCA